MLEKIFKFLKKNLKWIICIVALVIFIEIVENIFENDIYKFDNEVYFYVSKLISDSFTAIFKVITNIASAPAVILICILAFIFIKDKKYGKYMSINLVAVFVLNQILKQLFNRPRPDIYRIIDESRL